jgi:hypothetical protein
MYFPTSYKSSNMGKLCTACREAKEGGLESRHITENKEAVDLP